MVWQMCFQIEEMFCGSEVITPQSLKSSFFFAQNVNVTDAVRLPFGQFFDSTRTNLIE
jgi:hypothetical protein